jgi:WhiB family transcriptional regulator, redox-sensing transcriptional regulator
VFTQLVEMLATDDLAWQDLANCRGADPNLFFPERGASTRTAKGICRECSVRAECLEFAIVSSEKFGIWGGLSERERRKIRRERAAIAAQRKVS